MPRPSAVLSLSRCLRFQPCLVVEVVVVVVIFAVVVCVVAGLVVIVVVIVVGVASTCGTCLVPSRVLSCVRAVRGRELTGPGQVVPVCRELWVVSPLQGGRGGRRW